MNDAFLLIVGDIYAGDPEGHRYYTQLIDGLRGRDDVLCVASYVPVEAVGDYMAAADVVVLPYTRTYQSGVLLAAYAAGRPVVVTDTGGLGEIVEAGKSGFVVPPRDVKALANGIVDTLADAERLSAMGEHARYLATTVYAWDAVASRTIELYRSVAGKRRRVLQNGPSSGVESTAPAMRKVGAGKAAVCSTLPPKG
jgi:glycosyltransferase involved in cell wall biosynthesis